MIQQIVKKINKKMICFHIFSHIKKSQVLQQLQKIKQKIQQESYQQAQALFFKLNNDYPDKNNDIFFDAVTQQIIIKRLRVYIWQQLKRINKPQQLLLLLQENKIQIAKQQAKKQTKFQILKQIQQIQYYRLLKSKFLTKHNICLNDNMQDQHFQMMGALIDKNSETIYKIQLQYRTILNKYLKGQKMILDDQFKKMPLRLQEIQRIIKLIKFKYLKYQQFMDFCLQIAKKGGFDIQKDEGYEFIKLLEDIFQNWSMKYKQQFKKDINKDRNKEQQAILVSQLFEYQDIIKKIDTLQSKIQIQQQESNEAILKQKLDQTRQSLKSIISSFFINKSKISHISFIRPNDPPTQHQIIQKKQGQQYQIMQKQQLQQAQIMQKSQVQQPYIMQKSQLQQHYIMQKTKIQQHYKMQKSQLQQHYIIQKSKLQQHYKIKQKQFQIAIQKLQNNLKQIIQKLMIEIKINRQNQIKLQHLNIIIDQLHNKLIKKDEQLKKLQQKDQLIIYLKQKLQKNKKQFQQKQIYIKQIQAISISDSSLYSQKELEIRLFQDSQIIYRNNIKIDCCKRLNQVIMKYVEWKNIDSTTLIYSSLVKYPSTLPQITQNNHHLIFLLQIKNQNVLLVYIKPSQEHQEAQSKGMIRQKKVLHPQIKSLISKKHNFIQNITSQRQSYLKLQKDIKITYQNNKLTLGNNNITLNLKTDEIILQIPQNILKQQKSKFENIIHNILQNGKIPQNYYNKLQIYKLNY